MLRSRILNSMSRSKVSHSKLIQSLLTLFPALKPKEIERLLGERGVSVDANLIGVARLRHRREYEQNRRLRGLLKKLLTKRLDLLPAMPNIIDDLIQKVVEASAARRELSEDELVEALAAELPPVAAVETFQTRLSRLCAQVFEEHPHYQRAYNAAFGARGKSVCIIYSDEGLSEDMSDDELKAAFLAFLEEHYPAAPTVEATARAYIDKVVQRAGQDRAAQEEAALASRNRVERISKSVADGLGFAVTDADAVCAVVEQLVGEYADLSDEEIADDIIARLEHVQRGSDERKRREAQDFKGMSVRRRP